jgi:hypothetical protein
VNKSHYRHIPPLLVVLVLTSYSAAAVGGSNDGAADTIVRQYRTDDPIARVKVWQAEITHPSGNPKFKEFQAERLKEWEATGFAKHRLDDPQITALVAEVIRPVLRQYPTLAQGCEALISSRDFYF